MASANGPPPERIRQAPSAEPPMQFVLVSLTDGVGEDVHAERGVVLMLGECYARLVESGHLSFSCLYSATCSGLASINPCVLACSSSHAASAGRHAPRDARTPVGDVSAYPVPPVGHRVLHQPVRQDQSFSRAHQKASVAFDYRPPVPVLMRGGGEPDSYSASFQVRLLSKTRCRWVSSESRYANW